MAKVQYNPSTDKVIYNPSADKVQIADRSFIDCPCDEKPIALFLHVQSVCVPDGCYNNPLFSGSNFYADAPDVNGVDIRLPLVKEDGCFLEYQLLVGNGDAVIEVHDELNCNDATPILRNVYPINYKVVFNGLFLGGTEMPGFIEISIDYVQESHTRLFEQGMFAPVVGACYWLDLLREDEIFDFLANSSIFPDCGGGGPGGGISMSEFPIT